METRSNNTSLKSKSEFAKERNKRSRTHQTAQVELIQTPGSIDNNLLGFEMNGLFSDYVTPGKVEEDNKYKHSVLNTINEEGKSPLLFQK